jgi:hypothetical protein
VTTDSPTPNHDDDVHEDDFLAFWRQHRARTAAETKVILGVRVPVPTELPLALEDLINELQDVDVEDDDQVAPLIEMLFGADVYGQWKRNGLTTDMLLTLFVWGASNGGGNPMTFEEAAAEAAKWAAEGKARPVPNRSDRRRAASSKTSASAKAGRSSSRTSAASTTSRRKTSRT